MSDIISEEMIRIAQKALEELRKKNESVFLQLRLSPEEADELMRLLKQLRSHD